MPNSVLKYLEGLDKQAANLEKLIGGSTLAPHVRQGLIDIHHYLTDSYTYVAAQKRHEQV